MVVRRGSLLHVLGGNGIGRGLAGRSTSCHGGVAARVQTDQTPGDTLNLRAAFLIEVWHAFLVVKRCETPADVDYLTNATRQRCV
jgi:hypothetical protein